jgi:ubiquinone/menaquinone biosynthesis C-methylase UbiE
VTEGSLTPGERDRANELQRRSYAKAAPKYDKRADFSERWMFGSEHRGWACSQATGNTLEVAIGTGLNLANYPPDVRITGIDLTPEMLVLARKRAADLGMTVTLCEGDAQALPFADGMFDTVLSTYSMCSVPDDRRAVLEMKRVLKAGGRLILVDHVRSSVASDLLDPAIDGTRAVPRRARAYAPPDHSRAGRRFLDRRERSIASRSHRASGG